MKASKLSTHGEIRIAIALTAALLFSFVLFGGYSRSDFAGLYAAGSILLHGNASQLYDLDKQAQVESTVVHRADFLVYSHPPMDALLFAPFALLPFRVAYVIWGAIGVLLWVLFQHRFRPYAPVPRQFFRYLMLCAFFIPLWLALFEGQTSPILLVLYSLAFTSMKRNEDFTAGIFLGLGLLKFQLVLPFALICLLRGRWKLIEGFALVGFLLGVLSVLTVGPGGLVAYARLLITIIKAPLPVSRFSAFWGGFGVPWNMPTLKGFLVSALVGRVASSWIGALITISTAFLILFTAWRWRQDDKRYGGRSLELMFAAAMAVTLVTGVHFYVYDMTLMIVPVLLTVGCPEWSLKSVWHMALLAVIVILYAPPTYLWLLPAGSLNLLAPVLVVFALSALALAGRSASLPGEMNAGRTEKAPTA